MISIIISSVNNILLKNITKNIEKTIGVPYEIISFDNSKGTSGLCKLYNEGTRKAKYDVLCFIHEDIEIRTSNWGRIIIKYFEDDPMLGLIGLAGSSYKSTIPSGWHSIDIKSRLNYYNIIQGHKRSNKPDVHFYSNPKKEKLSRVVCVDGVWLCTPKQVALEFPFDEERLKGFHVYDIDFSLAVNQKYKVAVTYEILLKHFSEGYYSYAWFKDIVNIHKKWNHILPLNYEVLTKKDAAVVEKKTFRFFIKEYNRHLTVFDSIRILNHSKIWRVSFFTHLKLYSTILKRHVKKTFAKPQKTFEDE